MKDEEESNDNEKGVSLKNNKDKTMSSIKKKDRKSKNDSISDFS